LIRNKCAGPNPLPGRTLSRLIIACILTCGLGCAVAPGAARADDGEPPKPAPRTAITIGAASIVLVAANGHLYGFVDRTDDNAPVADAELDVTSADGATMEFVKATDGLFAAPFNRAGHMHDAFMVTLRSALASGDAPAEIAYDDLPDTSIGDATTEFRTRMEIALGSLGIGALAPGLLVFWRRGSRLGGRGVRPALPVASAPAA
jgi:hypothetical protein